MEAFSAARGVSFCLAFALLLAVTACGGGGGSGGDGGGQNETSLTLSSSAPVNGAINVLRTHSLVLNFSAALSSATATTSTVSLRSGAGTQNITVATSGSQLTITPTQRLFPGTRYTLNVSADLRGTGDQRLTAPVSINFTTDGSWRGELPVARSDLGLQWSPRIAADAAGNVLAVWMQHDGTKYNIWASRLAPAAEWSDPQAIEDLDHDMYDPEIAVDAAGNAIVAWTQYEGTQFRGIWSSRYVAGTGWGRAEPVFVAGDGGVSDVKLATDSAGNALAVWFRNEQGQELKTVWSSRYTAGNGWSAAGPIDSESTCYLTVTTHGCKLQIAMNKHGNAAAVWTDSNTVNSRIIANRYTAGAGWSRAQILESDERIKDNPQIAIADSGDAVAIWRRGDQNNLIHVLSSRYQSGSGWGEPAQLTRDTSTCPPRVLSEVPEGCEPQIALDSAGNAVTVWAQTGTSGDIWFSRYAPGSGWGTPEAIGAGTSPARPRIGIDSAGNLSVVWIAPSYQFQAKRYTAGSGWGAVATLNTPTAGMSASNHWVTIAPDGGAYVCWAAYIYSVRIPTSAGLWSNRFE